MTLTPIDIQLRLNRIASLAHSDPEAAHTEEDRLHVDVFRAIAEGAPRALTLARLAVKSTELNFRRWRS